MNEYKISEIEQKLIEKYQINNDQDIAMYFYNKLGKDVLNILYSKISLKFSSIPLEREDLTAYVWKSLEKGLKLYKAGKENLWSVWIHNSYFITVREIQKYFKNSELILNYADSLDKQQDDRLFKHPRSIITYQKTPLKDVLSPIVDYVSKHSKKYTKTDIKKIMYLKSFGYSEREIAKKMHISRRYVTSMIKCILRISKDYLRTSNR